MLYTYTVHVLCSYITCILNIHLYQTHKHIHVYGVYTVCLLIYVSVYTGEEEARLRSYKDIMIPENMVSNKDIDGSIDDTAAKDYEGDFM